MELQKQERRKVQDLEEALFSTVFAESIPPYCLYYELFSRLFFE